MLYQRTFRFSASHFNSYKSYQRVWGMRPGDAIIMDDAFALLADIHGHNFKVVVDIEHDPRLLERGKQDPDRDWLIDDVELERVVMEWSNTNLSMHPDFFNQKIRATTERMAEILYAKLNNGRFDADIALVTVYETDDIYAQEG